MARENNTITLNTNEGSANFTVQELGGMGAAKLYVRLSSDIGPGVVGIATAFADDAARPDSLPAAVRSLFDKLTPDEFERITIEVLRGAFAVVPGKDGGDSEKVDIDKSAIDRLFKRHAGSLFRLVWFALYWNYADFFDDLGADIGGKLKKLIKFGTEVAATKIQAAPKSTGKRPNSPSSSTSSSQ